MRQRLKVSLVQRKLKKKKKNDVILAPTQQEEAPQLREQPLMPNTQSSSMIEDAEMGGSASCVTNCTGNEDATKEINGTDIMEEPMVQKAIELFEARKVTVQSKI